MSAEAISPFLAGWASGWMPDERLTVSQWADKHRKLGSKSSAEPGDWRTDRAPYLRDPMDSLSVSDPCETVVLMFGAQTGKALALDTPIATPTGWATMGSLCVGDQVFDQDGKPCTVTVKSEVFIGHRCYEVEFSDGERIVADAGHRWETLQGKSSRRGVVTTEEMAQTLTYRGGSRANHSIPLAGALQTKPKRLPIDPYVLGLWLGDGNRAAAQITSHVDDVMFFARAIAQAGHRVLVRQIDARSENARNLLIDPKPNGSRFCQRGHDKTKTGEMAGGRCEECHRQRSNANQHGDRKAVDQIRSRRDSLSIRLRSLGLHIEKSIPPQYLRASATQRLFLLRGLLDTDGTVCKRSGRVSFCSASELLTNQVLELCWSLGLKPTVRRLKEARAWSVDFMAYREHAEVFLLPRKRDLLRSINDPRSRPTDTMRRRVVAVREVETVPVQCIAVDSDRHLFLAGRGMVPTHNTETGNNFIGYVMHHAPGPMMAVQPTVDMAKRLSKQRLADMIEQTPALRERVAESRSRDSGNTLMSKEFQGGVLVLAGANSATGLRSMPARFLFLDECDAYPLDVDDEGDPVSLAIKRTTTFGRRRKVLITSTPTVKDVSRIEREYERSDKRRYFVACPHCGHRQWLRWRGYNDDPNDARAKDYRLVWLDEARTAAGYKCGGDGCEAIIEEFHKTKMLLGGEWVPTAPGDGKTRGYQLSSLYSPLGWKSWVEVLEEFERVAADPAQLKVFVNTILAETWEDATTVRLDAEGLAARADGYELGTVPDGAVVMTVGIDLQRRAGGYAQLVFRAWGEGDESWLVDRKIIYGDQQKPELWRQVLDAIDQEYPHASGVTMKAYAAAIDSGDGETTHHVYAFARANRGRHVLATKGMSVPGRAVLGKPTKQDVNIRRQTIKNGVDLWPVGSDTGKSTLHARIRMEDRNGPGVVHWPAGLDPEYWRQLTAERQVTKFVNGMPKRVWVKKDADYNEDLDCEVLNIAALEYVKTRHNRATFYAQMSDRLEKTAERLHNRGEAEPPPPPVGDAGAGRISLSGWRR